MPRYGYYQLFSKSFSHNTGKYKKDHIHGVSYIIYLRPTPSTDILRSGNIVTSWLAKSVCRAMGSNPFKTWIFSQALTHTTASLGTYWTSMIIHFFKKIMILHDQCPWCRSSPEFFFSPSYAPPADNKRDFLYKVQSLKNELGEIYVTKLNGTSFTEISMIWSP